MNLCPVISPCLVQRRRNALDPVLPTPDEQPRRTLSRHHRLSQSVVGARLGFDHRLELGCHRRYMLSLRLRLLLCLAQKLTDRAPLHVWLPSRLHVQQANLMSGERQDWIVQRYEHPRPAKLPLPPGAPHDLPLHPWRRRHRRHDHHQAESERHFLHLNVAGYVLAAHLDV